MQNEEFDNIDYDLIFSAPEGEEDSFQAPAAAPSRSSSVSNPVVNETSPEPLIHIPIREEFPLDGSDYCGGHSTGLVYTSVFQGKKGEVSYDMICTFLKEEGYGDIPLPKDFEELLLFKLQTRNKQILLFEDNGYVHNPIKILFPKSGRSTRKLILEIYNEKAEGHLLRFHRKA